jgi:riboflavin synthase alpha subunit
MENKELQQYIQDVVHLQTQIKFFHWQTKIYAKHIALDGLFGAIVDNIDEFTETAMGKYGRIAVDGLSYTFTNVSDENVVSVVDGAIDMCIKLTESLDAKVDTDLLNLRDELLGKLNQTKYLLTLK